MPFVRTAQAKWDRRHLITVSTHLTRAQYARLRRCVAYDGTRIYRLVRRFLLNYITVTEQVMASRPE